MTGAELITKERNRQNSPKYPIPDGWERVTEGTVRLGDRTWLPERRRFETVTEGVLRHLDFLAAREVGECLCIIRKTEAK